MCNFDTLSILLLFMVVAETTLASEMDTSKIDVNQAVENPALVACMEQLAKDSTDESKQTVWRELNQAVYLAAMLTDELHMTDPDEAGQSVIQESSLIKVIGLSMKRARIIYPYVPTGAHLGVSPMNL